MEAYLEQVKKAIEEEKGHALRYKKAQKLEHAKLCMWRLKLMQQEITEVEQQ